MTTHRAPPLAADSFGRTERSTAAIEFIAADIAKVRSRWRPLSGLGLLLGMGVALLAFGWRDDYAIFSPQGPTARSLAALTALVLLVALLPVIWAWSRQPAGLRLRLVLALMAVAVAVSLLPQPTAGSVVAYGTPARFVSEAAACLGKGLTTAVLAAAIAGGLMWHLLPRPNRQLQLAGSLLPAPAAATLLALHCSGTSPWHVLLAHWGCVVLIAPFAFWLQRRMLSRALKQVLGEPRTAHLGDLARLAD